MKTLLLITSITLLSCGKSRYELQATTDEKIKHGYTGGFVEIKKDSIEFNDLDY